MSQKMRFNTILETVGNTPVVKLHRLAPKHVNLYVKIEAFNPMGSVKDRLALGVIEAAERSGELKPGQTVVEATSGNTGIGLAMVCAQKGYPLVVTMAESFSVERRKLMRFLGAKVVLTPAAEKGTGMLNKAIELAKTHGWFLARQFENEANADMHSNTTAQEILRDFAGERLDYWVTGYGTGGTLKGVARVLRKERPETKIVVCEPDNAALLNSGIAQERDASGSPTKSHPTFRPHPMQGWTPDFISKLTNDAVDAHAIDQMELINGADAMAASRELARQEGIFVGITAGATLTGALRVAKQAPEGTQILCMLPDTGERYLSTPLFDGITEDMTDEEIAISRSSPNYQFQAAAPGAPPVASSTTAPEDVDTEAKQFVEATIDDRESPVVLFALEWCEFCWSLRKLFAHCKIPYRSVDLDSVPYQKDNWGGRIRTALNARTGAQTIPQVFVGGEFIGGSTDVIEAFKTGRFQAALKKLNVAFETDEHLEPHSFLPQWLHPRSA